MLYCIPLISLYLQCLNVFWNKSIQHYWFHTSQHIMHSFCDHCIQSTHYFHYYFMNRCLYFILLLAYLYIILLVSSMHYSIVPAVIIAILHYCGLWVENLFSLGICLSFYPFYSCSCSKGFWPPFPNLLLWSVTHPTHISHKLHDCCWHLLHRHINH